MNETMNGASIADAVNLANDLRRAFGENTITDLLPGVPGDAEQCILAQSFNFDIAVTGDGRVWCAGSRNRKHIEALAEILNADIDVSKHMQWYSVDLPESIGRIAAMFDDGALDQKYYESDVNDDRY